MNNRTTYIITALLWLLIGINAIGQHTIVGNITDQNGYFVPGIDIHDDVSNQLTTSDQKGQFTLKKLAHGEHVLTLFGVNYNTTYITILLERDTVLNITLDSLHVDLSAVEISARKKELFSLQRMKDFQETTIYAGKKTEVVLLDLIQGNVSKNVGRQIYAQVAGLNIYEGNDGGLQLGIGGRGLDPNRTANFNTRQNGYDISADVLGYPENYYTPPSEAISEIQIVRGASSLQYGTQFGGLINFKLRKLPDYKKWGIQSSQTIGSYGIFHSFNTLAINRKKLSAQVIYNFKRGDGYRADAAYHSNNAIASIGYKLNDKHEFTGEFTYFNYLAKQAGGLTDSQFADDPRQSTRKRNWFNIDWKLYNLKYSFRPDAQHHFTLNLFGLDAERNALGYRGNPSSLNSNPITSLDEADSNGNYVNPRDIIKGSFQNIGIEAKLLTKYKLRDKKAVFLVGAKYYQSQNTSAQGPGSQGIDANFSFQTATFPDYANQSFFKFPNLNLALFGEHIFYLNERLSITPGFRWEYIRTRAQGHYNQVIFDNAGNAISNKQIDEKKDLKRRFPIFGIGVEYKQSPAIKWFGNLSQNYRSVTFSDIRVVSPTFKVDPNIRDEKGLTADLGVRGRWRKVLSYDAGWFAVLYDDRIGIILDDRANRVRKNIGKAFISGLESLVEVNIDRIKDDSIKKWSAKWFVNSAFSYSRYISSLENNVVGKKVEFIPLLNIKSGLSFGYRDFTGSVQWTYLSTQYTDVQNSPTPPDGDQRSGIIGEIPAYHIWDISLGYKYGDFRINTGINNALNRSYFTRRATGYPGPGIIPSEGKSFYLTLTYQYSK